MVSQRQRSDATRAALMAAFRASFLEHGFEATTTEAVLAAVGLSKGALYHHFRSKTEVAEAIYRDESAAAIERALASVPQDRGPLERIQQASGAWLREVRGPELARLLFEIGPAAIGHRRAKQIEDETSLAEFERLIRQAVDAGEVGPVDARLAARMLNALIAEAALQANAGAPAASEAIGQLIEAVLTALAPAR